MLQPQPHEGPSQTVRDRQRIESLHRLLNRSEAGRRIAERDRDLARWQAILDANKIAALQSEVAELRSELSAMAGEIEDLKARLARCNTAD
jgi:chromosome segregation ATPase